MRSDYAAGKKEDLSGADGKSERPHPTLHLSQRILERIGIARAAVEVQDCEKRVLVLMAKARRPWLAKGGAWATHRRKPDQNLTWS